mmetsp:Transcript_9890/g.20115  ORF Transcript_9890/g.20115 Transcript_9890/m.20115 type:complete len:141 (-) Transcript_9890:346-768(-)
MAYGPWVGNTFETVFAMQTWPSETLPPYARWERYFRTRADFVILLSLIHFLYDCPPSDRTQTQNSSQFWYRMVHFATCAGSEGNAIPVLSGLIEGDSPGAYNALVEGCASTRASLKFALVRQYFNFERTRVRKGSTLERI